ncbi:MAG: GspH/FimT family protein [Firmicutes bacterium]|nr:GspH/FimT family protein [Bacillota bacterium]
MKNCQNGFTLIELVVVLGILATLSGTILFTANGLQRRSLENAMFTLQADLRHAQRMAVIEGRYWQVLLNTAENSYSVGPANDGDSHVIVYFPNGIELASGNSNIRYLPRGTVSGSTTLRLKTANFTQRMTINVGPGRAMIYPIERTN